MKKLLPCCILAVLLLISYCTELIGSSSEGELGNTAGNITNGGTATENEDFYFWSTLEESDIYKVTKDLAQSEKIFDGIHGGVEMNVSDGYIYFTDGVPGRLQKMTIDGENSKYLTMGFVENVVVSGGRIYYKAVNMKNYWNKVYSCNLNGRNRKRIAKNVTEFSVDGETIYYIDMENDFTLWAMDISGKNKRKLNSEYTVEVCFDDRYIYYIVSDSFNIFRMDKETLQTECINNEQCACLNVYGDWIYYSENRYSGPLCRMSKDGKTKEVLLDEHVAEVHVIGDLVIYRSLEKNHGKYMLNLKTGENTQIK